MQIRTQARKERKLIYLSSSSIGTFQHQGIHEHVSPIAAQDMIPHDITLHPNNFILLPGQAIQASNLCFQSRTDLIDLRSPSAPSIGSASTCHQTLPSTAAPLSPIPIVRIAPLASSDAATPTHRSSADSAARLKPPFQPPTPSTWPPPARHLATAAAAAHDADAGAPPSVPGTAAAAAAAAADDPFHCDWPFW